MRSFVMIGGSFYTKVPSLRICKHVSRVGLNSNNELKKKKLHPYYTSVLPQN